jgi:hypothetical protein
MQTISIDGYEPEPVIAHWVQVGKYKLPLASVSNQNDGGLLRRDFVGDLNSGPNVFMPQWSAPTRGAVVNQTGGMVVAPINSYSAGQTQANPITVNADQASLIASFLASQNPRSSGAFAFSTAGGE